ncbi:MAG TPA: hypothetical protein VIK47_01580 [Kiloniellales bacterium]
MKVANHLAPESEIFLSIGQPPRDRRLTDKILGAFNHAYASGEIGVAAALRRALEEAELGPGYNVPERRTSIALVQADLWVEFVEARKAYGRATERQQPDPAEIEESRRDMIDAYRRWSDH